MSSSITASWDSLLDDSIAHTDRLVKEAKKRFSDPELQVAFVRACVDNFRTSALIVASQNIASAIEILRSDE